MRKGHSRQGPRTKHNVPREDWAPHTAYASCVGKLNPCRFNIVTKGHCICRLMVTCDEQWMFCEALSTSQSCKVHPWNMFARRLPVGLESIALSTLPCRHCSNSGPTHPKGDSSPLVFSTMLWFDVNDSAEEKRENVAILKTILKKKVYYFFLYNYTFSYGLY